MPVACTRSEKPRTIKVKNLVLFSPREMLHFLEPLHVKAMITVTKVKLATIDIQAPTITITCSATTTSEPEAGAIERPSLRGNCTQSGLGLSLKNEPTFRRIWILLKNKIENKLTIVIYLFAKSLYNFLIHYEVSVILHVR